MSKRILQGVVISDKADKTIVVRVEWPSRQLGPPSSSGETAPPRHVELRTVMADPFRGGSGGGGQAGEEPGGGGGTPE